VLRPSEIGVETTIERVPYDAEAVAPQVAAAGPPGEHAEKLVAGRLTRDAYGPHGRQLRRGAPA
jgi:hypothetical protein